MQKILLLTLFLFAAGFLKAAELPRLNLEIGKKYTIETIYHEDTSKTNPRREYDKKIYEFIPTSFNNNDGTYDINLIISYYMHVRQEVSKTGAWTEKEVYETGYVTTHRNPTVYLNMFKVPVKFKITKNNKITSFDFSEYNKTKTPEGMLLSLGEWDLKSLRSEISALFFDPEKTQSFWSHEMDIRSKYRVMSENETALEVEVENSEKAVPKGETGSTKEQFQRKIRIDKTTGLILEDNLSFVWNFMGKRNINRYQKWIPVFSEEFEVNQKVSESVYEKTNILHPNTSLRITVKNSAENSGYIYLTYYDLFTTSLKSFRLEKDKDGVFNFQVNLDKSQGIYVHFNPDAKNITKYEWVNLIPGDNLEVEIGYFTDPDRLIFNGIGAEENRVIQRIRKVRSFKITNELWLLFSLVNEKKDSVCKILNNNKSYINPDLYLDLRNTLLYGKFFNNTDSFEDSIDSLNLPICNSLAARNALYLNFLAKYIAVFKHKIRRSSTNYNPDIDLYESNYSFAQVLFPEPILNEYLAFIVEGTLQHGKWEKAKLLYERYKINYVNNPRFLKPEKIYQQQARFSPGLIFPIKSLTDINGNILNLRKMKNKLVVIHINQIINKETILKKMNDLQKDDNYRSVNSKEIVFVRLLIGNKEQLKNLKSALNLQTNETVVFQNEEDVYLENNPFLPILSRNTIVLGRDGIILFNREPDYAELQKSIDDLKKPVLFNSESNFILKILAFSLLGILIILGLAFIVYRQVSRRKLKRAELSRKMRELELTVIRTQMNPHFMYNCLNSIQNLVQKNQNEEAFTYLSKFASLVRQVLNNSKKEEIPLSKELDSVKEYIELEQLRFDFDYKIELAEGIDADGIFVPPMLLQPFVENALLHGLLLKKSNRLLSIRILKEQAKIVLVVEDNGVGREAAGKSDQTGNGQGILLCRNRLSLLSEKTGIHYELKIDDLTDKNLQPSGTRVSVAFVEQE